MIHTKRNVMVGNKESTIDNPITLYRGDRDVEVEFSLVGNKFTFTDGGNVIKSTHATHGQLIINTPNKGNMFSEITECHEGKVVFIITKEMIDELTEVGLYDFQIRLFDNSQNSRVTIPPVLRGIEIRNPIASEDESYLVDFGRVNLAKLRDGETESLDTFLLSGEYNKTDWNTNDVISSVKLNKIEDALYIINETMEDSDLALFNRIERVNQDTNKRISKISDNLESETQRLDKEILDVDKEVTTLKQITERNNANINSVLEQVDKEVITLKQITESNNANINSVLEQKINKGQVSSSDLKTSSDSDKIQINNLSSEVIDMISNPVQKTLYYPNGGFQTGSDVAGTIGDTGNQTVVCNTELIPLSKGRKIKLVTNFSNRSILSYYVNGVWSHTKWLDSFGEGFYDIPENITHVRITVQHFPDDTTVFSDKDIIEVYQGGAEYYYSFADGSVTTEKLADSVVDNNKLLEPNSTLIPWDQPEIVTTDVYQQPKEVILGGFFTSTENFNDFVDLPHTSYYIDDGYYLVLNYKEKTITTEKVETYIRNGHKYILFANFMGRLHSPIPVYQDILSRLYNNISTTDEYLIPWGEPEIVTTDVYQQPKEVILGGIFTSTENFNDFVNLPQTSYYMDDGYYLVLNYKEKTITTEKVDEYKVKNGCYILFANLSGRLHSPIPVYQDILSKAYYAANTPKGVINVAKAGGNYTTISEAVNNAGDSPTNPVTIIVHPGVYNESVYIGGGRNISIVGVDKVTCVLRDDSGVYANAPLEIQGNAYISNMTIVSTHDNDNVTNVDSLRSYAIHVDFDGEGTCEINNCVLISKQNAAIGSGLHSNQTLKIINCELYSETPQSSSMTGNGALFVHDGNNSVNQKLIVKDCLIKSLYGCSHLLNGVYGSEMTAHYYNNVFWCEETGKDSINLASTTTGVGIAYNIKLGNDSFGNNTDILNA